MTGIKKVKIVATMEDDGVEKEVVLAEASIPEGNFEGYEWFDFSADRPIANVAKSKEERAVFKQVGPKTTTLIIKNYENASKIFTEN